MYAECDVEMYGLAICIIPIWLIDILKLEKIRLVDHEDSEFTPLGHIASRTGGKSVVWSR